MAQKDKVLKVSFGAFSCTLEGFDDPVETLKEVTEYFRALSASDPGFGDEPKLPDTENLARLVQQDDSKSVNIRTNESGSVMLRAEDAEFVPTETEDDDLSAPLSENDKRGAGTKKRRSATGSPPKAASPTSCSASAPWSPAPKPNRAATIWPRMTLKPPGSLPDRSRKPHRKQPRPSPRALLTMRLRLRMMRLTETGMTRSCSLWAKSAQIQTTTPTPLMIRPPNPKARNQPQKMPTARKSRPRRPKPTRPSLTRRMRPTRPMIS